MNAGNLDELITIQRATQTKSATTGEVTNAWATLVQVWAQIKHVESGTEVIAGMQLQYQQRATFKIRYTPDVNINDRIFFDGESYHVSAITEIDRRMYLIISGEKTE